MRENRDALHHALSFPTTAVAETCPPAAATRWRVSERCMCEPLLATAKLCVLAMYAMLPMPLHEATREPTHKKWFRGANARPWLVGPAPASSSEQTEAAFSSSSSSSSSLYLHGGAFDLKHVEGGLLVATRRPSHLCVDARSVNA